MQKKIRGSKPSKSQREHANLTKKNKIKHIHIKKMSINPN